DILRRRVGYRLEVGRVVLVPADRRGEGEDIADVVRERSGPGGADRQAMAAVAARAIEVEQIRLGAESAAGDVRVADPTAVQDRCNERVRAVARTRAQRLERVGADIEEAARAEILGEGTAGQEVLRPAEMEDALVGLVARPLDIEAGPPILVEVPVAEQRDVA